MKKLAVVAFAILAVLVGALPAFGAAPLVVRTSVAPGWLYFGDTATERVDVLVDRTAVDANSVQINPSFAPWVELGQARTATTTAGSKTRKTWWFTISCLTFACLPKGPTVQAFRLPSFEVQGKNLDGTSLTIKKAWPAINVAGRFMPAPGASSVPNFHLQSRLPKPEYRLNPTVLADILDFLGVLLIVSGLAAGALAIVRWRSGQHRELDRRPPLERALALVRDAQVRDTEDRRRAVGLLARTLPDGDNTLPGVASEVAWSKHEPSAETLEDLARTVEAELEDSK